MLFFTAVRSFTLFTSPSRIRTLYPVRLFVKASDVVLPMDRLEFGYSRSSGPGGQNVNKLNTKAEVRFNVPNADWLSTDIRNRLQQYHPTKITKDGDLVVTSQEHRMQGQNREDCLTKLREMISEASIEPKERKMYETISEKGKQKRIEDKRRRSAILKSRRDKDYD